jgi:hypothetical protein
MLIQGFDMNFLLLLLDIFVIRKDKIDVWKVTFKATNNHLNGREGTKIDNFEIVLHFIQVLH